jgi:hypothetical protein
MDTGNRSPLYSRPIISTDCYPIYDARLGRSNWTRDEFKIMQIKNTLNKYGFDCSTIGKEIQPVIPRGKDFLDFEKDLASGGRIWRLAAIALCLY